MVALVLSLLDHLWPLILAAGGVVLTLWRVYANGRRAERAKQAARELEARDVRDQVVNDVSMLPPGKVRSELAKRAAK